MHIQKALDQMNLQVHRVLTEITGLSGLRILDAILAGERDPLTLARLCHKRVKSNESTVAKSLEGDYRPEHIFALRQSLAAYRYYQQLVLETDQQIVSLPLVREAFGSLRDLGRCDLCVLQLSHLDLNYSWPVSGIGLACMLLAFAAFSTTPGKSASVTEPMMLATRTRIPRLINRRLSLPRLLLAQFSRKGDDNYKTQRSAELT